MTRSFAFKPDGFALAVGYADSTILIWDLTKGKLEPQAFGKPSDADLLSCWARLSEPDSPGAHRAIWRFIKSPQESVTFLRGRLKPIPAVSAQELEQLVADLDANEFKRRENATLKLSELEDQAEPALQKVLAISSSPEQRRRIEALLDVPRIVRSAEKLRTLRAIEVLEQIGTAEACELLSELAKSDPASRVFQEARASLDRLEKKHFSIR